MFVALVNSEDPTLQFLLHSPVDAMLAIKLNDDEYLLAFSGKSMAFQYYQQKGISFPELACKFRHH